MTDTKLFKEIAATKLPEGLYLQIEPHLDSLLEEYKQSEYIQNQLEFYEWEDNHKKFHEIKEEFKALTQTSWQAFARERWPEIDTFFNMNPSKENYPTDIELPF